MKQIDLVSVSVILRGAYRAQSTDLNHEGKLLTVRWKCMQCRHNRDGDDAKSGMATANFQSIGSIVFNPKQYGIDANAAGAANCAEKSRPLRPFESDYLTIRL